MDSAQVESKLDDLKKRDWTEIGARALAMLVFSFVAYFALLAGFTLTVFHFIFAIFEGKPNKEIASWINRIGTYITQVFEYLSFRTDDLPFPLGRPLPEEDSKD